MKIHETKTGSTIKRYYYNRDKVETKTYKVIDGRTILISEMRVDVKNAPGFIRELVW